MKRVYLDYGAASPLDPRVFEAMKPYFCEKYGHPFSLHQFGVEANEALQKSRKIIANFINSKSEEVYFTSGSTESLNFVIRGVAEANKNKGKHLITSAIEHGALLDVFSCLERQGFKVTYLPVDKYGFVDPKQLEDAIRKDTILVSIMHANNEIGTIEPIEEISKICKEKHVLFHTDAVQTFTHLPIDVKKMNIDMMTTSSLKMCGPKGVEATYIKSGINIQPLIYGGPHEKGLRGGTENIPAIVGMGKMVEIAKVEMKNTEKKLTQLRDRIIEGTLKIDDSRLNGHPTKRLSYNTSFCFKFIEGSSLMMFLDMNGIAVSTGSACSTRSLKPSHVLTAIGVDPKEAQGSLRITLGKYTTKSDIDYLLKFLPQGVEALRKISPFKNG